MNRKRHFTECFHRAAGSWSVQEVLFSPMHLKVSLLCYFLGFASTLGEHQSCCFVNATSGLLGLPSNETTLFHATTRRCHPHWLGHRATWMPVHYPLCLPVCHSMIQHFCICFGFPWNMHLARMIWELNLSCFFPIVIGRTVLPAPTTVRKVPLLVYRRPTISISVNLIALNLSTHSLWQYLRLLLWKSPMVWSFFHFWKPVLISTEWDSCDTSCINRNQSGFAHVTMCLVNRYLCQSANSHNANKP